MRIPVFVSCPTALSERQEKSRLLVVRKLRTLQLEPRALGRSDYPDDLPLREVYTIAKHCAGGVVLGFQQFETGKGIWKKGTPDEKPVSELAFPTPWNHLESGILFALGLPLLVFREPNISGGVFDRGVTDVYVHEMPSPPLSRHNADALHQVFLKWSAKVRDKYYKPAAVP